MEQKSANQNMRSIWLVGGAFLFLLGLAFIINGIQIQNTYERAEGVIVDFVAIHHFGGRGGSGEIAPKVRFAVKNTVRESLVEYSYFTNPFLKIGDRVKILYSLQKTSPEIVFDTFIAKFGAGILSVTLGLLFFFMGRSIKYE
jgi:hypothetical protein